MLARAHVGGSVFSVKEGKHCCGRGCRLQCEQRGQATRARGVGREVTQADTRSLHLGYFPPLFPLSIPFSLLGIGVGLLEKNISWEALFPWPVFALAVLAWTLLGV